ncbi:MAG TPA: hypothetical protein VGP62_11435 [Bryobacteraceae bacterium]|jgi:hypothetical protein|nr:hypothetical protein [Bryobacteraceae bacterium]
MSGPSGAMSVSPRENADARSAGLARRIVPYAIVSLLIAIPCVWQPHIQAGDLSSHLYNAWLVNEVSAGHLPGLYVVTQFTNVLFDYLLSLLLKAGGTVMAEHVAVLLAVQIFFWGCFRLASVVACGPAWTAAPFLAIAAYGAVFRMGFFNFYLAVGVCAWAIAIAWQNDRRHRLIAIPLLAVACLAHPLPCLWAVGVIGYMWAVRRLQPSRRWWLLAIGLMCVAGSALFLARNVASRWAAGLRIDSILGADQVLTYSLKFKFVEAALLCFWILLLVRRLEMAPAVLENVTFQLLLLNAAAGLCMPDAIWFPHSHLRLTYIAIRLSLLSAILFCAVVAPLRMLGLEKAIAVALVILFFSFTYVDERAINAVEARMDESIKTLPPGARVVTTVRDSGLFLPALQHLVDRPCIGHCFDFGDYEPATTEFRLRARPGNAYVMTDIEDILDLENSGYVWRRQDIELYRLLPCKGSNEACLTIVQPGDLLVIQQLDSFSARWRMR